MFNKYNYKWQATWETNRGCPFKCTFCDWGSATASKLRKFEEERLYKEIDYFTEKKIDYINCADSNFGIIKRDLNLASKLAENKKKFAQKEAEDKADINVGVGSGGKQTSDFLDDLKDLGFNMATYSGLSISISDVLIPHEKDNILSTAYDKVADIKGKFDRHVLTEGERYNKVIDVWTHATNHVAQVMEDELNKEQLADRQYSIP